MEIHKKIYETINFFKGKDQTFIIWIGTLMRPLNIQEQDYIYKEAEDITESKPELCSETIVYFLVEGTAAYVLPRYNKKIYLMMEAGEHFGHVDIAVEQDMLALEVRFNSRSLKSRNMVRRFTVQAIENCDMFILRIDDLEKLKFEFPDMYKELFQGANDRLKCELLLKLEVISQCENSPDKSDDINSRFARVFKHNDY